MVSHTFLISGEWSVTPFLLVRNGQSHFPFLIGQSQISDQVSHFPFCDEWSVTLFLLVSEEWSVTLFLLVMNGQSHFLISEKWSVTLFLLVLNGQSHFSY